MDDSAGDDMDVNPDGSGMNVGPEYVPEEAYTEFVASMPEPCLDLVVEHDGAVLLGRRENEPARGEWFWPGSRIVKGETFEAAARRIADEELDLDVEIAEQLGANAHFWAEGAQGVSRHTVVVVYRATPAADDPRPGADDQHDGFRWVDDPEPSLHEYVHRYFERFDLPRDGTPER